MDDLLLPGTIPGLFRRCLPVVVTRGEHLDRRGVVVDVDSDDSFAFVDLRATRNDDRAAGWLPLDMLALDLTDATGRAHAAWWLAGEPGVSWGLDCDGHRRWELRGGERPLRIVCRTWEGIGPEARRLRGEPIPDYADVFDCPALDDLNPYDPRLLPDGSRWVDAVALARVCRHVARERGGSV